MATFCSGVMRLCLIMQVLTLVACGGGGGSGGSSTSSLAISITGLPAGLNGIVVVSGPHGFERTVLTTQSLANLAPGTYAITASDVLSGSSVFAPQPVSQNIDVTAGAAATAQVVYSAAGALRLALQQVVTGLSSPLFLTAPAGDPRLFILERRGRIRIVQNGVLLAAPFLDISTRVSVAGEGGLLSMAFDPQYASSGFFFVYFTEASGDIAVERFKVSAGNPNVADPVPLRILTVTHRVFTNHKGGLAAFGPDGFLYLGTGDGGGGGDPFGNAQNLNILLGKLLRIDVSKASSNQPYAIPPGNPFVGQLGSREEIWAYGLRNPWRFSFDAAANLVYIADVGEARIEEVDAVNTASAGLNFGWDITEGSLCFPSDPCSKERITLPVFEYAHGATGGCSIIGGHAYRGSAIPELRGRYFYSDLCGGWLRSLFYTHGVVAETTDWNIGSVGQILSFGEDSQNELYMLSDAGSVHKIVRQ